jgi:predicted ATPase/DNA-binding SARP family transcriptional activator/tetratricopeptide (TPR) repeat protein
MGAVLKALMDFRILGPLEVWEGDRRLALGGPKHRALLAILLLDANRVVSTDRLIELLWGEEPPETVSNTLQVCVSQLRKILEPGHVRGTPYQVLLSQEPGYLIHVGPEQLDLRGFDKLREEASQASGDGRPDTAAALLREAIAVWRGPPLADLATEPYVIGEAKRLKEMLLRAVEDRIEADLALGRHGELVGELEAIVDEHPLRERFRAQLMLALYRSGRQAEASELFHKTRAVLVEELGMEPGTELQKLLKAILNQDPSLELARPIEATVPPKTNNLPLALTSFVGRISEMMEVKHLMSRSRLLTLTGAGGIGKTRLALSVAAEVLEGFGDGVWLVELAPLSDPAQVPETAAAALGVRAQAGVSITESLIAYLGTRRILLLLDNCEHLVEASAKLVNALLRSCPELRILVTSREALSIDGERTWRVPSLGVPDPQLPPSLGQSGDYGAVALFVDRAATTLGSFELTTDNAALVLHLCQRLDGIPLAIELAAGKLKVLTLEQITGRLDDRFRLLTGGSRTALPRQKTLEATLDWSYALLPATEQAMLRRLSVFAGGFTLAAAESVCSGSGTEIGDVLETLARLVDKSLLSTVHKNRELRYYLLETVRQYAYSKLVGEGESYEAQRRHRDWFLTLAEQAESQLRGPNQVLWLARLRTERDNLRAAFEWSLATAQTEVATRIACGMGYFWEFEGHVTEGRQWFARLPLETPTDASSLWAQASAWAADLACRQYDYEAGIRLAEQSLVAARALQDDNTIARSLLALGNQYYGCDNLAKATDLYREALDHSRAAANNPEMAMSLLNLAYVAWATGNYPEATSLGTESLELNREIGDRWHVGLGHGLLGAVALAEGRFSDARRLIEDSLLPLEAVNDEYHLCLAAYRLGIVARCERDFVQAEHLLEKAIGPLKKLGERLLVNHCLCELGIVYSLQGRLEEASATVKQSALDVLELGDRWAQAKCLEALAAVLLKTGEGRQAALFFGAAEAIREEIGVPLESYEQTDHDLQVKALHAGRDWELNRKEWNLGRTMPNRDLISAVPGSADSKVKSAVGA